MRLDKKVSGLALSLMVLAGCSNLSDVIVKDELADDRTREMVGKSVRVVKAEHARQFDDPAWPTPIQVVVPREQTSGGNLIRTKKTHEVYLFQSSGEEQRIERLYVQNEKMNSCRAAIDGIGLKHLEKRPAYIKVGQGGGALIRCGSVVFESDTNNLEFRHPFITSYQAIDLADLFSETQSNGYLSESFKDESQSKRYPIIIKYLNEQE